MRQFFENVSEATLLRIRAIPFDFSKIESLQEFNSLAAQATVIFAVDKQTSNTKLVFGAELMNAIAHEVIPPQKVTVVAFAVDMESSELEKLAAAVKLLKGFYEG